MATSRDSAPPGRIRGLLTHLVAPADDWAYRDGGRRPSVLLVLMSALLAIVAVCTVLAIAVIERGWALAVLLVLLGSAAGIVAILMVQVRQHLLAPLAELYGWALRMCDGDLSARIPTPQKGRFAKLSFHINRLSEALDRLANEMDDMVWEQTERLQQKNQSLEVLYEIAAAVNTSDDLMDVLKISATRLIPLVGASAASVHLCTGSALEAVCRVGASAEHSRAEHLPAGCEAIPREVEMNAPETNRDAPDSIALPIRYQGRNLGLICLTAGAGSLVCDTGTVKLLTSIGEHLGMAVAKFRLDEEARNLSLIRERTSLAYELHDSLAQTIAALRFQVRNLNESLARDETLSARREIKRIESSLDEVNTEVRELIANFRAPMDERGLLPSLEDMIWRYRKDTGIATFLQAECDSLKLPVTAEVQVLGIVREALNNVRKHARAGTVRVLIQSGEAGGYRVLIEDDGIGISQPVVNGHAGEHIGLSIMRDRARKLGGELRIESESGEGTRIDFVFELAARARRVG